MAEENIAGELARQDAALADTAELQERLERDIRDLTEDNRTREFTERTRSEIASLRQTAEGVHDAYTAESEKLYRQDGQRKYSDAQHREISDDLKRQRDEAFSGLKERADKLSSEVSQKVEVASKPERYLSDKEMEQANGRRDFVREEVERLALGEVPGLLREAELSGDRVEKWLTSRYATIRAERELEKLRESGGAGAGAVEISGQIREVREGVERLQESLQLPGSRKRREDLKKLSQEAYSLKSHVMHKSITHEEKFARSNLANMKL